MKALRFIGIVFFAVILTHCKLPSFSLKAGGKSNEEIPGKSIQVNFFENRSNLASSNSSIVLTEGLREIVLTQSKKELVSQSGDWIIEGVITDYRISPIAIQAGSESAAQNRLTMTVSFTWEYVGDEVEESAYDLTGTESVSSFVDYDASSDFSAVEDALLTEIVRQMAQDIYDRIFGGKW
ncbi:MAG: LptE family protein [Flavobacteriales bacterium]|nr:LptE family protein [Flavobacteriales bacterium]